MRNADVGELAEARVDSVNDFVALNDLFDRFARSENTRPRSRRNANGLTFESDRCELNKGNLIALQFHSRSLVRIPEKEKGQVGTRPGLWAKPTGLNWVPDLFSARRWGWGYYLVLLRASPQSESGDHNGHDHDRFQ